MAGEVVGNDTFTITKLGAVLKPGTSAWTGYIAGDQMHHSNPSISTTAAAIAVGTVNTANDWGLWIRNTDATNRLEISTNGGSTYTTKILPGQSYRNPCFTGGTSIFIKAITAAVIAEIFAWEVAA